MCKTEFNFRLMRKCKSQLETHARSNNEGKFVTFGADALNSRNRDSMSTEIQTHILLTYDLD